MLQIRSSSNIEFSIEKTRSSKVSGRNRRNQSRLSLQRPKSDRSSRALVVIAVAMQQSGTGRSNRAPVAIAVSQQLSRTKSSCQTTVVMTVALIIHKLIAQLNCKSRESLHRRKIYRNRSSCRSVAWLHCVHSVRCFSRTLVTFAQSQCYTPSGARDAHSSDRCWWARARLVYRSQCDFWLNCNSARLPGLWARASDQLTSQTPCV